MKYKIICFLVIFNLIRLNAAFAFFLHDDHFDAIRVDHTPIGQSTQENNVFYLYDNFTSSRADSCLIRKNHGYLSADQVEINLSLKILAKNGIDPENSIDRMLLANLRIKKLMNEYAQLQEKTRLMLQDTTMAGTRKSPVLQNPDLRNGQPANIEEIKKGMDKKLLNIDRLSNTNQSLDLSQEIMGVDTNFILKKETNALPETVKFSKDSSGLSEKNNSGLPVMNTAGQILTRKENTELPWVFTVFLKTLKYIMANRIEISLYMIFIVIAGYFISLKARR